MTTWFHGPSIRQARRCFVVVVSIAAAAGASGAQPSAARPPQSRFSPEVRVDALFGRTEALHLGAGGTIPAGTYVRAGIIGAAGFSRDGLSGRIDILARFHLDPFREKRWAPYGGAGLTTRYETGEEAHTYLMILAGADGPVSRGWAPSVEAALGGGGRVGIVLRRATAERR